MVFCSVDSCTAKRDNNLSSFRCPKDAHRCEQWRNQLQFIGNHRFANISPEECYDRIRVCSLHFTEDCFLGSKQRLSYNAVPTLFLSRATTSLGDRESNSTELKDAQIQTDSCNQTDEFVQTESTIKTDEGCQTSQKISFGSPRKVALRNRISSLEKEATQLKKKIDTGITLEDVEKFLTDNYPAKSHAFLKAQLLLMNKAPKGSRYTDEFKQFALSIYFLGPKAYKKLSTVCRLPSKSTLERFTKHWVIEPGFNDFVFQITKLRVQQLQGKAKDCILCIDEISIKSNLYYNISRDKVIGFEEGPERKTSDIAGNALVLMARGIASSWKQPIAYFFYKTSSNSSELKDILFETIRKLNATGLDVLAVVSDQGSNFYKLVKTTLELTADDPCFLVDGREVIYFFDVPHLVKTTRNNFFTYKFVLKNGSTNKIYLEKMYALDKTKQYKLAPKISNDHIYPNNFQKMKVKLATQVFSHSVAVAMFTYIDFNALPEEAKPTAEFIENMNVFFDLLNSNTLENFGAFMGTQKQMAILEQMDELFETLKVENSEGRNVTKQLKFIFGWRLTIKAFTILFRKLQTKEYKYLFTRNINQDCLENFFGQIRNSCGHVKNPTPIQFWRAFKKIFSMRYFDHADGANCMEDINEVLLNITPEFKKESIEAFSPTTAKLNCLRVHTHDYRNLKTPEGNALVYVTGYFLRKCLQQHTCETCESFERNECNLLGEKEKTFCQLKSYNPGSSGGLVVPNKSITEYVSALENIFTKKFAELACEDNVGKKLKQHFSHLTFYHPCEHFPRDYLLSLYTRVRIYFSLKFANRDIGICKQNKLDMKLAILQHL